MRGAIVAGFAAAVLAALPAGAAAQYSAQPWNGTNPFVCTLQQAGSGTAFPDPGADPFCVEYDKTHQSVADGGVADFLSKEPARVAAASPKCFYFQRDHWTGSIVQGQAPETYHWDGSYFFDKARGLGGAYVENFRLGGQLVDPTQIPGFPDQFKQYFSGGRGGVETTGDVTVDQNCAARPDPHGGGGGNPSGNRPYTNSNDICRVPGGQVDNRGIGGVMLGMRRAQARRTEGLPATESMRYIAWCFDGGGRLIAALRGRGDRARVDMVITDASPFDTRGIRPGASARVAKKHMRGSRRLGRSGRSTVLMLTQRRQRRLFVGIAGGRVSFLAVSKPGLAPKRALRYLRALNI